MENFFARLQKKPEHHKKRFALLSSATITLFIFGFWSVATFGTGGIMADANKEAQVASVVASQNEVGPFESLRESIGGSIGAIAESFKELVSSFNSVDFEADYTEMKGKAIESYGR